MENADIKQEAREGVMPFLDHLKELRRRIIVSVAAILAAAIVSFVFYDPIVSLLFAPFSGNTLYINTLFEGFIIRLQVAFISGLIVTFPLHLFNLIRFIFPALLKKEKKIIILTLISSFFLIALAIYYGYFQIIPVSIRFLTSRSFVPGEVGLLLNFKANIFFILQFLFIAILAFQFPILLELLMIMNIVKRKTLLRAGRFVVIIIIIFAGVITPGDIALTQLLIAFPMIFLYLLTIFIAKIFKFGEEGR